VKQAGDEDPKFEFRLLRARHLSPQRSDSLTARSETLNHKLRSTLLFALSAISSVYFGRTTN
jgi:hypothetical protein